MNLGFSADELMSRARVSFNFSDCWLSVLGGIGASLRLVCGLGAL